MHGRTSSRGDYYWVHSKTTTAWSLSRAAHQPHRQNRRRGQPSNPSQHTFSPVHDTPNMTTFMTLPAEIRKYIYELSLRNDCMYKRMYDCRRPHPETKPAPGILFVSKQMFRESIRIFYSLNICCVRHESRYLTGFPGFQVRLNSLPWHDMGNQFSFDHIEAPHLGRLLITLGLHVNTPA